MDTLSHGLYGGIAFGRASKRDYFTAFFFGMLPDLASFGAYFILMALGYYPWPHRGPGATHTDADIPTFVHVAYSITHSFIIYGVLFAIIWFLGYRRLAKLSLAWPLHILVDMPTHSLRYFPTPFLWPLLNWHIDGIPWSNPWIFIPNVIFLVVLYTAWYLESRRQKLA